jgi:hypothetical protein
MTTKTHLRILSMEDASASSTGISSRLSIILNYMLTNLNTVAWKTAFRRLMSRSILSRLIGGMSLTFPNQSQNGITAKLSKTRNTFLRVFPRNLELGTALGSIRVIRCRVMWVPIAIRIRIWDCLSIRYLAKSQSVVEARVDLIIWIYSFNYFWLWKIRVVNCDCWYSRWTASSSSISAIELK